MYIGLKSISESFRSFISTSGKYILFTTLLYSLWLVRTFITGHTFDLESFSGRMVGLATFHGYDVGARVSLFYKSVSLLLFSFAFLNLFIYALAKKNPSLLSGSEVRLIEYSSLTGLLLFLFEFFGYKTEDCMEMVYFTQKLMLGGILLRLLFFRNNVVRSYTYLLIIVVSISLYFFIADCNNLYGQFKNPEFYIPTFVICCLLLIGVNFVLKKHGYIKGQARLDALAYIWAPLCLLPLISVLKDEAFLVLLGKQVNITTPLPVYFSLLFVLSVWIFVRYKKSSKQLVVSQKRALEFYYLPLTIFSLITYVNYRHYLQYSGEGFEAGNKYLAVMEFKLFGVIPTLEKFNSHLVSDYFFSAIYTFLNGMKGREMELYDFFYASFAYVMYYYLVYYISRNSLLALLSVLVFPLYAGLLPESYAFGIFSVFALNRLILYEQTLKTHLFFFIAAAGTILWRIDLGYTCVIAMILVTLYYHIASRTFKINWVLLFKALIWIVGFTCVLLAALSAYRHTNLFRKTIYALNYFTSAQTYGYIEIGAPGWNIFKMHYFVFPIIVSFIIIALVLRFKDLNRSLSQRTAFLALLFSCVFYIINFNRGLVRHSFVEGVDHFTSSLFFLIVSGSVFVFFKSRSQAFKTISFFSIAFILLINYKMPEIRGTKSYLEVCLKKIAVTENSNLSRIGARIKNQPDYKKNPDKDFIEFMAKNTSGKETFIDFTNSPMLYYYTKKLTPSYFYQNPTCNHNDFLQNVFLEELKDYSAPYLLFTRHDDLSRDMMDEVPNTVRHYRMAEYFFQHYEPYVLTGVMGIWKRKDVKGNNVRTVIHNYIKKEITAEADSILNVRFQVVPGKKYLLKIAMTTSIPLNLKAVSDQSIVPPGFEYTRDTLAFKVMEPPGKWCDLRLRKDHIQQLELTECDYIPDFRSHKFCNYDLLRLPYIWANYGEGVAREPLLFEKNLANTLQKETPVIWQIPEGLDKTSGNTVIISCKNSSTKKQRLRLSFRDKREKYITTVLFDVVVSDKAENYAIRISSLYKWYSTNVNEMSLTTDDSDKLTISKIKLTKGM